MLAEPGLFLHGKVSVAHGSNGGAPARRPAPRTGFSLRRDHPPRTRSRRLHERIDRQVSSRWTREQSRRNGRTGAARMGFFQWNLAASPPAIDTTLGGQYLNDAVEVRYSCGFPTGTQTGACWFQDSNGAPYRDDKSGAGYTGQQCVTMGGIPALDVNGNFAPSSAQANPNPPDFTKQNAYYVWQRVTIDGKKIETSLARKYATTAQTDDAIDWINKENARQNRPPWMCTVSYNSIHTPYQQPPLDLYPRGFIWPVDLPIDASNIAAQKVISDLMLIAMDKEIGRLLVGTGLAREGPRGDLIYEPALTDTMVVVVGDNGSFFPSVNLPYTICVRRELHIRLASRRLSRSRGRLSAGPGASSIRW